MTYWTTLPKFEPMRFSGSQVTSDYSYYEVLSMYIEQEEKILYLGNTSPNPLNPFASMKPCSVSVTNVKGLANRDLKSDNSTTEQTRTSCESDF